MEDIKIIELFFNRDETAIQELSNKYSGYCYKIVWNLLNNHEDVEECLNDTWLAAWEYIPPRRPSVLSAYVGKIARGFAIDCFRKKQAAKRMDGHVADVCGAPLSVYIGNETKAFVLSWKNGNGTPYHIKRWALPHHS